MCKVVVLLILLCATHNTTALIGGISLPNDSKYDFMVGIIRHAATENISTLKCGGTFIRKSIILTNAHCLSDYLMQTPNITYSVQYAVEEIDVNRNGISIETNHVHFHPNYTIVGKICQDFDIAVITLPFSDDLTEPSPINVCQEHTSDLETLYLISWRNHSAYDGPYKLNYVHFLLSNATECNNSINFCACGKYLHRANKGDSGSPLIKPAKLCQVAIYFCGAGYNMEFINISNSKEWIAAIIDQHEEEETTTEGTTTIASTHQMKTDIDDTSETVSTTQRTETQSTYADLLIWLSILCFICIIILLASIRTRIYCRNRNRLQMLYSSSDTTNYKPCESKE